MSSAQEKITMFSCELMRVKMREKLDAWRISYSDETHPGFLDFETLVPFLFDYSDNLK